MPRLVPRPSARGTGSRKSPRCPRHEDARGRAVRCYRDSGNHGCHAAVPERKRVHRTRGNSGDVITQSIMVLTPSPPSSSRLIRNRDTGLRQQPETASGGSPYGSEVGKPLTQVKSDDLRAKIVAPIADPVESLRTQGAAADDLVKLPRFKRRFMYNWNLRRIRPDAQAPSAALTVGRPKTGYPANRRRQSCALARLGPAI